MRDLKDHLEPLDAMAPFDRWADVLDRDPRHLVSEPRPSRAPVFVFTAATLALVGAIAIWLSPLDGGEEETPAAPGALPGWLVDVAYEQAYLAGDLTPRSAEWILSTRGVIAPAFGLGGGDPDVAEYLVVLHGDFTFDDPWPETSDTLAFAVVAETRAESVWTMDALSDEVRLPELRPFELPPRTARVADADDGWSVIVPPGWQDWTFATDWGPAPTTGSAVANIEPAVITGGPGGTVQVSSEDFPHDGIALVVARADGLEPRGEVAAVPFSIDDFSQASGAGGSEISTLWFERDGTMFTATIRIGRGVSAIDEAAMREVVASLAFDVEAGPGSDVPTP